MKSLAFTKMQGLGNDFVVVDATVEPFALTAGQIRALADRRFGVGCDQVLVVERPTRADVDFRYRIFNADGGEVEQCGNGARYEVVMGDPQGGPATEHALDEIRAELESHGLAVEQVQRRFTDADGIRWAAPLD